MIIRPHDMLQLRSRPALAGSEDATSPQPSSALQGVDGTPTPAWVDAALTAAPFVIARRAPMTLTKLAVGVRGRERHQRWPCTIDATRHVLRVIRPPDILATVAAAAAVASATQAMKQLRAQAPPVTAASAPTTSSASLGTTPSAAAATLERLPALRQLCAVAAAWRDVDRPWGPTGSVAFELATGVDCVTPASDLDIVIYADATHPMTRDEARRLIEALAATTSLTRCDVLVETPDCAFSLAEYAATSAATPLLLRTIHGPRLAPASAPASATAPAPAPATAPAPAPAPEFTRAFASVRT